MSCWAVSHSRDYGERFARILPSRQFKNPVFSYKSFQFTCFKWEGSLAVYTKNSDWRPRIREIMQVIYFLLALAKFQWLFELISVTVVCLSTCVTFVYASFCIAFAEWKWCKHLRDNRNWAFNTSNYIRSVVGEVHLLNLINELLLFLSISLIFDIRIYGRKK